MGVVEVLRRQFPFRHPAIVTLPAEELAWPAVSSESISVRPPELHGTSGNLLALAPSTVFESPLLKAPQLVPWASDISDLGFEVVDLLKPLALPAIQGTIFIKKEQEETVRGVSKKQTRVEAFRSREKLDPKSPKGLDVFEMLLPVLMPPAATEFSQELLFPQELYPFQRAGVKWLFESSNALLADDMGLGKTVQAITAFRALLRRSKAVQALVICPKSVLPNWMRELERWAPELVATRIHGTQPTRRVLWKALSRKCHVLVTNYETVRNDIEVARGCRFDVIIADEVQRTKNDNDTSRAVRELMSERRWGLTGTPLENTIDDVVNIFAFVKKGLFRSGEGSFLTVRQVQDRIRPFLLRRRKEDARAELQLKEMYVDTKYLELTESQRESYDAAERNGVSRLKSGQNVTLQHVLALIQELKQICNFDPMTGESTKIGYLRDYLEDACAQDNKAIVVSQYVKTLGAIERQIEEFSPLLYSGELSTTQRDEMEKKFRTDDKCRVLLLSLRAGGLGLNLTRANYLLHFDRWWNPAVEDQASARIHRIGQLKNVFITRLVCEDTIEERIERLLEQKRMLFAQVVDDLSDVKLEKVLSEEELFGLFGLTPPQRTKAAVTTPQMPKETAPVPKDDIGALPRLESSVVKPDQPYSNLVRMRQILRSAEEYIWWADLHFDSRALEELIVVADPSAIRDIRILSGPANVTRRGKRDFSRFQQELTSKGIATEWRVLDRFAHDRFLMSKNYCFNVPPVNSWFQGSYAEVLKTQNRPPFDQWWTQAASVESIQARDDK